MWKTSRSRHLIPTFFPTESFPPVYEITPHRWERKRVFFLNPQFHCSSASEDTRAFEFACWCIQANNIYLSELSLIGRKCRRTLRHDFGNSILFCIQHPGHAFVTGKDWQSVLICRKCRNTSCWSKFPASVAELDACGYFKFFYIEKWQYFAFSIKWTEPGVAISIGLAQKFLFFKRRFGLEVSFWTTLQNRKLWMPSSALLEFNPFAGCISEMRHLQTK